MTEIDCLLCRHKIILPDYVHERYDGEVRCGNCLGRLRIVLEGSEVRKYKVVSEPKAYTWDDFIKSVPQLAEKERNVKE